MTLKHRLAARAATCAAAFLLIATARSASAQADAAPDPPAGKISTAADILRTHPEFRPEGGDLDPNSPAAILGPAFDVAERLLRLSPEVIFQSPALSERSRGLLHSDPKRQQLARMIELREAQWRDKFVDARFARDRLATLILLFTPRDESQPPQLFTLDLVRKFDEWQVTFDLSSDAELPLGEDAAPAVAALRAATDRRLAEVASIVSAPLEKPLPFHGTWTTHFQQSNVYLTFNSNGEVFVLQTREGSASYGVYDFHLTGDEVVIEMQYFPIRLKKTVEGAIVDGQRYDVLVLEDPGLWFPGCRESLLVSQVTNRDAAVRRPSKPIEKISG